MKYSGVNTLTEMIVKIKEYVNSAIAGLYTPAGSVAFANLPALSSSVLGYVYDVSDDFTTDNRFVEPVGKSYSAHTNVVVVQTGSDPAVYKFDVLTGMFDFHTYVVASPDASGLPDIATPDTKTIYLVPITGGYNMFFYNGTNFVKINIDVEDAIINGYFNDSDNLFYEESTFVTPITGATNKMYVDISANKTYRYNGTIFERLDVDGSGGGSLGKQIIAQLNVGGISKNDTFNIGTSYDDLWDSLLNPIFTPEYVNPSCSLAYSVSSPMEVGAVISSKTATVGYNAGSITVNGVKQNDRGGAATGYAMATSGADTEYSDSSASSGSFSVPALTRSTKGTLTITGTVSYAQGPQPQDSKGNDVDSPLPAGSVTKSTSVSFILPFYYGKSASTTIADFTGLTKSVTAKGQKQFKFTTNNEHMVFAYDSSYGNLTSILDPNSFEVISGWTKKSLTVGGFTYNVYVADSATTDIDAQFTFKF